MARPRATFPAYRLHKATGQAVVTIDGRDHYLGQHGTPESRAAYERLVIEWKQHGTTPKTRPDAQRLTVRGLFAAYWRHIENEGLYEKNGRLTTERSCISLACRPLIRMFGDKPAAEFTPVDLQVVRAAIAKPVRPPQPEPGAPGKRTRTLPDVLARGVVNKHVHRIRRMFRWGVSMTLVPAETWQALLSVPALRRGSKLARETRPVQPVEWDSVQPVLEHLSPQLAAVAQFMWWTGARPTESLQLRACDIDRSGAVWQYAPHEHKLEHMGRARIVPIGPRAQLVLRPFLDRAPDAYLFDPREAVKNQMRRRRAGRKTQKWPSHLRRHRDPQQVGSRCAACYCDKQLARAVKRAIQQVNADRVRAAVADLLDKKFMKKAASQFVTTKAEVIAERLAPDDASREAIVVACQGVELLVPWTPNQLRHSAATRIRRDFGLEAASVILGHSNLQTTQVYAEADRLRALEVAEQVG